MTEITKVLSNIVTIGASNNANGSVYSAKHGTFGYIMIEPHNWAENGTDPFGSSLVVIKVPVF
jgi:hypothetical protein